MRPRFFAVCRVKPGEADECPADGVRLWDCLVQRQRLLIPGPGTVVIRSCQGDVTQAFDAVGLAKHGPGPLEQRQRPPVAGAGACLRR